jgi:hypothetical protein
MGAMPYFVVALVLSIAVLGAAWMAQWYYSALVSRLPEAAHHDDLNVKITQMQVKLADLEADYLEVTQQRETEKQGLAELQAEKGELIERAEKARAWLEENGLTLEQLRSEIDKLHSEYVEAKDGLTKVQTDVQLAQQQRQQLDDRLVELRREEELLARAKSEQEKDLEKLEQRVEEAKESLEKLKRDGTAELADLAKRRLEAEGALRDAENRFQEARRKIEDEESRIAKLREQGKELDGQVRGQRRELSKLDGDVQGKKAELDGLVKGIEAAQKQHIAIVKQIDKWGKAIKPPSIDERLADLYNPYLSPNGSKYRGQANETALLGDFQSTLSDHHLVFPERALRAFHTSLKVADISPLVVLAGISGTGKSLLPRLYAEFMGIHFLNVAVQPRWDSPQDLFGFYNYMENRYKATELARLLRQMDVHNNPDEGTKGKRLQDGMAIVLLDEMNLARVEYYFSELLSKLEVRRGIDLSNAEKRRQAEIEIESGPMENEEEDGEGKRGKGTSGNDHQGTRIFVGMNTLFVGTMNEDETTQMLSDKVIDRANVLRFGRPSVSANTPPKELRLSSGELLSVEQWKSWQRDQVGTGQIRDMQGTLQGINEKLEVVGRSFGRRVQQAIGSYIQRYPGSSNSRRFNEAFADQIEQKIIPKLAGLERDARGFDAARSEIERAIQSTDDAALLTAFRAACESDLFSWRGVRREEG